MCCSDADLLIPQEIVAKSKTTRPPESKREHFLLQDHIPGTLAITTWETKRGLKLLVKGKTFCNTYTLNYPVSIWKAYPAADRMKLMENIAFISTFHMPFMGHWNRLEYNTSYPLVYSWTMHTYTRQLPSYRYDLPGLRDAGIVAHLRKLLNIETQFSPSHHELSCPSRFAVDARNVLIPFTFGKDSFLSYHIIKEIGLEPVLIWCKDMVSEGYELEHKEILWQRFLADQKQKVVVIDNDLGELRARSGMYGWECVISSWLLMCLPVAFAKKCHHILFSNEYSCNYAFHDPKKIKIWADFTQSWQAAEEMTVISEGLSGNQVITSNVLESLDDLAIIGILKHRYAKKTFPYLMSCWSEKIPPAKENRWCGICTKCARIYIYLLANGIDPVAESGFATNMLVTEKRELYNVFGSNAAGTGFDSLGLNTDEQSLAFFVAYLRGHRDPLVLEFVQSELFDRTKKNFYQLVDYYYSLHEEQTTPLAWRNKIYLLYNESLRSIRREIKTLYFQTYEKSATPMQVAKPITIYGTRVDGNSGTRI